MQIARLHFIQPADPTLAHEILDETQFDMRRVDKQLRSDAATGALISSQLTIDTATLAGSLRRAGGMISSFGSREALLGPALARAGADLLRVATELRAAQASGGTVSDNAAWLHAFEVPTQLVHAAIDVLDSSSTWG